VRTEYLRDGHEWLRVADPEWDDPLDPSYAARRGGRWNPPGSFPVLYCAEDVVTARLNVAEFARPWPYQPGDLRPDAGPVLVSLILPRRQRVADVHSPAGVRAAGLPKGYPRDDLGRPVGREACRPVGVAAHDARLRGVRCRSARSPEGAGRELAWFPATSRSRATPVRVEPFDDWYWA